MEIAPDDLSNLVLCIFLLTHGDNGDQKGAYDVKQKQKIFDTDFEWSQCNVISQSQGSICQLFKCLWK